MQTAGSPTLLSDEFDSIGTRPVGGPVPVAWREGTLTRAKELESLVFMMLLATVVALVGLRSRILIPLCFAPQQEPERMVVVCPTNQSDPSERYGIPLALAWLKLPTGAITAFLGLLLMRGQFVPGLSALDSSAQILAWALVFGYAQQLFTRLVDQQGQTVLETVRGADKAQPTPTPP